MANTHATSHEPRIGAPAAVREAQTATGPQRGAPPADKAQLAVRCINTMRTLAMDAVQQANSGHPSTPMALAPVAFVLWDRHLRHNSANPQWPNRDRFMLSNGHASMLLYVLLYLTQHSNNNAYCQDNETSWYAWHDLERHQEIARFTRGLIAFRRAHPILSQEAFSTDAEVHWCSPPGGVLAWTDPPEQRFACQLHEDEYHGLSLMFNASTEAVDFLLHRRQRGHASSWPWTPHGQRQTTCVLRATHGPWTRSVPTTSARVPASYCWPGRRAWPT
jgi:hypothetical protein